MNYEVLWMRLRSSHITMRDCRMKRFSKEGKEMVRQGFKPHQSPSSLLSLSFPWYLFEQLPQVSFILSAFSILFFQVTTPATNLFKVIKKSKNCRSLERSPSIHSCQNSNLSWESCLESSHPDPYQKETFLILNSRDTWNVQMWVTGTSFQKSSLPSFHDSNLLEYFQQIQVIKFFNCIVFSDNFNASRTGS